MSIIDEITAAGGWKKWCQLHGMNARHGHARKGRHTPTYNSWEAMITRCTRPNHVSFADYGGRGIVVDPRWRSFENFLADMTERLPGTTLDRIDPDGNYEPGNCRWATPKEQRANWRKKT